MSRVQLTELLRNEFRKANPSNNMVGGVGVNDADYMTVPRINGVKTMCPAYSAWTAMIYRAYSGEYHERNPTYRGAAVCNEWLSFMSFRKWWISNHRDGWALDKDLLVIGNKKYGPKECLYVPVWLNTFTLDCGASRGKLPIGVTYDKRKGMFMAQCKNLSSNSFIGYFCDPLEAHVAWRERKNKLAKELKPSMDAIDLRIYPNICKIIMEAK